MATNPTLLTQPIAANGAKNVIPNTTSTAGAMSQDQGFPAETALPLGAGGVAPTREDFNGAFNLLSGLLFYAQKGWQFEFDETQDYFAGCIVRDTLDGKLYEAINDVSASSTHPSADSVNWKLGTDMSAYTTTVNSPMFNKRDVVTTSGTYTAPVTGWYKITAKGGGGGGAYSNNSNSQYYTGGGGGEGGTSMSYEQLTAGDTVSIVIGAGGAGATTAADGADGGNTSYTIDGNTTVAYGGEGGGYTSHNKGYGGNGNYHKGFNGEHPNRSNGLTEPGSDGGGYGGGKGSWSGSGSSATANTGCGGAGGSASSSNYGGGNGADGFVWFEYFDSSLNP